ncbi:MAG TPA: hypothetical protein VL024_09810, partial [Castellaniella sp.]|nr:hypothetical protein [Castellaniella sp.]
MRTYVSKTLLTVFAALALIYAGATQAERVRITQIANPDLVDIKRLADGEYMTVADVEGLRLPLSATRAPNDQLHVRIQGKAYELSRGDVTLDREKALVVDACKT